jgi:uncharacterized membrane protein YoaK (UPF0700 family)
VPQSRPSPARTLLVLTFVTGIVDAVSFLGLGGVFSATQTGNVVFLGIGIAGAAKAPLLAPLVGLLAFLAGSGLAVLAIDESSATGTPERRLSSVAEVSLLGLAALIAALADISPGAVLAYLLIAILSLTMGLRNTLARRRGDPNLVTTVLTLTLTAFSSPAPLGTASGAELAERAGGLLAVLGGAVTGALLLKSSLALALAVGVRHWMAAP